MAATAAAFRAESKRCPAETPRVSVSPISQSSGVLDSARMTGLLDGIWDIAADLSSVISARWLQLLPYLAIWFALHAVAEFGIPALIPSAYDFIGRKEAAKGGKPISRHKLAGENSRVAMLSARRCTCTCAAADMRNKIVATLMAGYLVPLCFWALFVTSDDSHRALRDAPYGSTALSDVCFVPRTCFVMLRRPGTLLLLLCCSTSCWSQRATSLGTSTYASRTGRTGPSSCTDASAGSSICSPSTHSCTTCQLCVVVVLLVG